MEQIIITLKDPSKRSLLLDLLAQLDFLEFQVVQISEEKPGKRLTISFNLPGSSKAERSMRSN